MSRSRGRRAGVLGALVLVLAPLLQACSADSGSTSGADASREWQRVSLPAGVSPVTLTPTGSTLLIGGYVATNPRARLLAYHDGSPLQDVPLAPHTPYAFEARWLGIATDGKRIVGVGGARGGAHANVRWTVWTGSMAGLVEHEQTFETFGGWGAGDLTGVAFAGSEPVVSGSWVSERTGLDVAVWRAGVLAGKPDRWVLQPSAGTPLQSTPKELAGARSLTSTGTGLALSGSVTQLGQGSIAVRPAVWFAATAAGPWTRVALPSSGSMSEAQGAVCAGTSCVVAGQSDNRLAVWQVSGSSATAVVGVPKVGLPERALVPPPASAAGRTYVVVPAGANAQVLVGDGERWTSHSGPAGTPIAVAALGGRLYVVSQDSRGATTLWSAPL